MFERFTEGAIKVIMLAQEESRRLGHNFVGTEQILLGLIGQGKGIAARTLKAMGIDLKDARTEVEKIIGRGSGFVAVEIPFTPRAKRVLEVSWQEARRLKHNYIGTEHLLLGVLHDSDSVAVNVLQNLYVDFDQLRSQLDAAAGGTSRSMPTEPVVPESTCELSSRGPFTWYHDQATLSIGQAWEIAENFGVLQIEPEHLLFAVIRESGTILGALTNSQVSISELRRQLIQSVEFGDTLLFPQALTFSERSKRVLAHAWSIAVAHESLVSKECIFLALLDQEDGILAQSLSALNVDIAALRASIDSSIKSVLGQGK
jgi:ATP-dependent Clp protease ATP-binding subunit ClpA